jgi:hypothetical protein
MGLGADVVDDRGDCRGHAVPLRCQEGFAQMEFCSEELAGKAKDGDE